jgi:hypothetical protein
MGCVLRGIYDIMKFREFVEFPFVFGQTDDI